MLVAVADGKQALAGPPFLLPAVVSPAHGSVSKALTGSNVGL